MIRRSATRARLRFLLGSQPGQVAALVIASVFVGLTESAILTLVAQAAAALVDQSRTVHVALGPLHVHAAVSRLLDVGVVLAVVRLALMFPISSLPAQIAANVQARLRRELFSAFTRASWSAQSRDLEGHLQELMTSQVAQAAGGTLQVTQLVTAAFTLLMLVLTALVLNVLAAAFVSAIAVVMFAVLKPLNELGARRARALSEAQMAFASGVGEATRLSEETHVFGVAGAQRRRMDALVGPARDMFYSTQLIGGLVPNIYRGLIYVFIVFGLAALNAVHAGHVASLGAVVLLLVRAGGYGQAVQGSYQLARQSLPFVDRVREAERRYAASSAVSGERRLAALQSLTFRRITFAYNPGRPVLSDISFELSGRGAVGVVGPSGAGKSTLVQLLLRLRIAQDGQYLVNGFPAEEYTSDDWHARVAYVSQSPRLLHASVAANIRYFRDLDDGAVERAARLARIHADIVTWAEGYDTVIGPRADAISGGQQQRICIARALVGQPEVLLLDEPASALDPRSESLLQESLLALKERVTLIIIAHRLSTLDICDRVMVIEGGRLVAFDTAERLRKSNAYYRHAASLDGGRV